MLQTISGNSRTLDLQVSPPGGSEPPSVRSEVESASTAARWFDFFRSINLFYSYKYKKMFEFPFTPIISGASGTDKTKWINNLLKNKDNMINKPP